MHKSTVDKINRKTTDPIKIKKDKNGSFLLPAKTIKAVNVTTSLGTVYRTAKINHGEMCTLWDMDTYELCWWPAL